MRDLTIGEFLDSLAARQSVPGGGASAALHAAQAAALLAMVARYSDGPRYSAHAEQITAITEQADLLTGECVQLATADGEAFAAVAAAYSLPRDTAEQQAARSAAISSALAGAAAPQAAVIAAAGRVLGLVETLLPIGNRNVITDLAASAEALRAAVATARANVAVNVSGLADPADRAPYDETLATADEIAERAGKVTAAVRADIAR